MINSTKEVFFFFFHKVELEIPIYLLLKRP